MKLRNLSVLLFAAACGGGGDGPGPTPVDSPNGDGGGFFPNSRNDMILVTFPEEGSGLSFTPDTADLPEPSATTIDTQTGGFKLAGEMGIAGDRSDEYFERDTFEITTGPTTNEMTIRLAWDGGTSDHDYFLLETITDDPGGPIAINSGTLIADDANEFSTFVVEPNHTYWLWTGVYQENAGGGQPSLPAPYDFSIYGGGITPATVGPAACDTTEGADNGLGNNAIEVFGGTVANREVNNIAISSTHTFCGTLQTGKFLLTPDADDSPTLGTDDVDAFEFDLALEGDLLVRIIGRTDADQAAIDALVADNLIAVALFNDPCVSGGGNQCADVDPATNGVQPRPQQFFTSSEVDYVLTHGVTAFRMIPSTLASDEPGQTFDIVGPKTLAVFMQSNMPGALTAPIQYKVVVTVDARDTRAGRIAGAANYTEARDN